jgi:hypothetical protein
VVVVSRSGRERPGPRLGFGVLCRGRVEAGDDASQMMGNSVVTVSMGDFDRRFSKLMWFRRFEFKFKTRDWKFSSTPRKKYI